MKGRLTRRACLLAYYAVGCRLPSSNFPGGRWFRTVREALCRGFLAAAGSQINIESGVFVADGAHLCIGSGSALGTGCRIYGADIGEAVIVAPGVVIFKDNHIFEDLDRPIAGQGRGPTRIAVVEDWAWIGERAMIMPGRRVGRGAIVGAGAVVTRDVEPYSIVAGNPARVVGRRARRPAGAEPATAAPAGG